MKRLFKVGLSLCALALSSCQSVSALNHYLIYRVSDISQGTVSYYEKNGSLHVYPDLKSIVVLTIIDGADGNKVEAFPKNGYKFVSWSDGETTAYRTEKSVRENFEVTALFEAIS
jgi:hypothetical protein